MPSHNYCPNKTQPKQLLSASVGTSTSSIIIYEETSGMIGVTLAAPSDENVAQEKPRNHQLANQGI